MYMRTMCRTVVVLVVCAFACAQAGIPKGQGRMKSPLPSQGIPNPSGLIRSLQKLYPGVAPAKGSQAAPSATAAPSMVRQLQIPPLSSAPQSQGIKALSWNEATGVPREIELDAASGAPAAAGAADPVASARAFLTSNSSLLRIADPSKEFAAIGNERDEKGMTHVRFQQMYNGIEVWGGDAYVHVNPQGNVTLFNGAYYPTPALQTTPAISVQEALTAVNADLAAQGQRETLTPALKAILKYNGPVTKPVIWHDRQNTAHLAWFVEVQTALAADWYYFIDARTGAVLHRYNNVMSDGPATGSGADLNGQQRSFGVYAVSGGYYMLDAAEPMYNAGASQIPQNPIGAIVGLDLRNNDLGANSTAYFVASSNNQWLDPATVSAEYNAAMTYDYYRTVFGRNSIDNAGMTIYSISHVTQDSLPMDNAFWSNTVMCYGDGQTAFKPLAGGFDVGVHEMTHGVTQHTSKLIYQDQSGALNESMSDCFAAALDSANWTIGEQVIKDLGSYPTGSLRDLRDPHNGGTAGSPAWQPATMSEFVNTTADHGGVHVNSGIPNHAFYLVATGTGRAKAAAIWYKAQTSYLTQSAMFVDARIATEAAAKELFGATSAELGVVKSSWDAVGVLEGSSTPPPPGSQPVGANWVLAVNTDPNDPNSVYMAKTVITSNADLSPLSRTPVLNHPAVSDTSGTILFVGQDYRLHMLSANPANPAESVLDTNAIWWSVAIGPGLNRIALTTRYIDTSIYVIDLASQSYKRYRIQISTQDGAAANTSLYADALSFDPSGRHILFDNFNQSKTAQGDTLDFWTIDILDLQGGVMQSVFPPQPAGKDVGNPAFSKTSPSRFAFDYWDNAADTGYVLAADFFTGKVGQVTPPLNTVGYPTYSGDDRTIAYHTIENSGGVNHDAIRMMTLDTTKMAGTGASSAYLSDATFPFWFVIGSRVTGVETGPAAGIPGSFALGQNYPNPFNPTTTIEYVLPARSAMTLNVYNTLGQLVTTLAKGEEEAGVHQARFDATALPSGVYFCRLQSAGLTRTIKMMLLK